MAKWKVDLTCCLSAERYLYFSPSKREGMLFGLVTGFKTEALAVKKVRTIISLRLI